MLPQLPFLLWNLFFLSVRPEIWHKWCLYPKHLTDRRWLIPKIPNNFHSIRWGAERRVWHGQTLERGPPSVWGWKFWGIFDMGHLLSDKYLGHRHYSCHISGLTDKKNRFQSKNGSWGNILENFQCIFMFPPYLPNLQACEYNI